MNQVDYERRQVGKKRHNRRGDRTEYHKRYLELHHTLSGLIYVPGWKSVKLQTVKVGLAGVELNRFVLGCGV